MPNFIFKRILAWGVMGAAVCSMALAGSPEVLRVGVAGHAFDHLGEISDQAEAAAASGANIIYASGVGVWGYQGLPSAAKLEEVRRDSLAYAARAKRQGIRLTIGYVCATSMVGLETFDKNWTPAFRAQFHTPVAEWRQQDRHGKPLASWYGGKYEAACMNNPDWRAYEKNIVRLQLEAGDDGIFFDNPTVHAEGCYCRFCMEKFRAFLAANFPVGARTNFNSLEALRDFAAHHPREFMQFRCGIARDFLADIRRYARSVKRGAFITCNNSLNSPDGFFAQCRTLAYNINELSQAEDWITVEDMVSQPRLLANGQTVEYGPTYKLLHAISHGKPVVAVTLAEADYHTAPNLVRLAMAEAAANGASYLSWPAWPEALRAKMSAAIRPEAEFLRRNEKFLNDTQPRCDVALLLPFHRWLDTETCQASTLAAALARANIQFTVVTADELKQMRKHFSSRPFVLLTEPSAHLDAEENELVTAFQKEGRRVAQADQPDWLQQLNLTRASLQLEGPASVRAVVSDQGRRTLVHLYNLGIERISSFEDKVHPAQDIRVTLRVPYGRITSVRALTADAGATSGPLEFSVVPDGKDICVKVVVPRLEITTMLVVEGKK